MSSDKLRIYGSDVPFCDWLRKCADIPSNGDICGVVVTDVDIVLRRWLTDVDGAASRNVSSMMHLEVKTRNGEPDFAQRGTLFRQNLYSGYKKYRNERIRNYGVYVLSMSGVRPDEPDCALRWGRFDKDDDRKIIWRDISYNRLISLLRFDVHPISFSRNPLMSHHGSKEVVAMVRQPLGFVTPFRCEYKY